MSEGKAFLEKIHIKNFLSLRDVTLPFKPLTVLVGPNASGKSNTLSALYHLNRMITEEKSPFYGLTEDTFWAGEQQKFSFDLQTKIKEYQTQYHLEIKAEPDFTYHSEQLSTHHARLACCGVENPSNKRKRVFMPKTLHTPAKQIFLTFQPICDTINWVTTIVDFRIN